MPAFLFAEASPVKEATVLVGAEGFVALREAVDDPAAGTGFPDPVPALPPAAAFVVPPATAVLLLLLLATLFLPAGAFAPSATVPMRGVGISDLGGGWGDAEPAPAAAGTLASESGEAEGEA